jgi:hypothetical protein
MIFIDGDHEMHSVIRDVEWAKRIMPKGLLCGHDADNEEVQHALRLTRTDYTVVPHTSIWVAK